GPLLPDAKQHLVAELLSSLKAACASSEKHIRAAAEVLYAESLYRNAHYREASVIADRPLSDNSKSARLLRVKANVLVALGRFSQGIAAYEDLLARDPGNTELKRKTELLEPLATCSVDEITQSQESTNSTALLLVGVGGGIGD